MQRVLCFLMLVILCSLGCKKNNNIKSGKDWNPNVYGLKKCMLLRKYTLNLYAKYGVVMINGNRGICCQIGNIEASPGFAPPELEGYELVKIIGGMKASSALKIGTWSNQMSALLYGSEYFYSSTPNSSIEFSTTGESSKIGIYDLAQTSTFGIVEINGDRTLANQLPTAQDLVTNQILSSSALVSNGGIFNPTDRVLNPTNPNVIINVNAFYGGSRRILLASELEPGTKTVKIINSGISPMGVIANEFKISGLWWNDDSLNVNNFPNAQFEPLDEGFSLDAGLSDLNFAFSYIPTGGSTSEFIGHSNTQKLGNIPVLFKLDNSTITSIPENDFSNIGDEVSLNISAVCKHSQSADDVAKYNQSYYFSVDSGIKYNIDFEWLKGGTISSGYIPQFAVNNQMSKSSVLEDTKNFDLSTDDGISYFNNSGSLVSFWNTNSKWSVSIDVPEYRTNPIGTISLQDRFGGSLNKVYFKRYSNQTVNAGDKIILNGISIRFKKITSSIFDF